MNNNNPELYKIRFLVNAIAKYGELVDYSKVIYKNMHTKVELSCKIHGEFTQTPNNHLKFNGCKGCSSNQLSISKRKNIRDLRSELKNIHNNSYKYPSLDREYISEASKITITCPIHSDFKQLLSNHIRGIGCPLCGNEGRKKYNRENPRGWCPKYWAKCALNSDNFDSFKVYIIKCTDTDTKEEFYKIGKTYTSINKRFKSKSYLPYHYEIIKEFIFQCPYECSKFEQNLKNINKTTSYKPLISFKGQYECFSKIVTPSTSVSGTLSKEELVS